MFNAIMHQSIKLNKLTASKNENKLLTQNFDELYNKLSLLTTIKVEEKIGKINGEYFIFYNNWRRQLWRWVYSENRDKHEYTPKGGDGRNRNKHEQTPKGGRWQE